MDSRGLVFRSDSTGQGNSHSMEYRLDERELLLCLMSLPRFCPQKQMNN